MKATTRQWRDKRWLGIGLILIVVALVAGVMYVYTKPQPSDDVEGITSRVARHMLLPTDETPALLTVTDPSRVSSEFLKQAQAGDRVLVYQLHKKAIIYRPSSDRIVDVGPVIIDTPQGATTQ